MQALLALLTGVLFAAGVYLTLQRTLLRMVFGMGRVARLAPPLVPLGAEVPLVATANPLPQALVPTAVVIGFVLAYRSFVTLGSVETAAA